MLSNRAQAALDELLELPRVRGYSTYEGSRGRCFEASLLAVVWLRSHGAEARILRFLNPRVVSPFSRAALLESGDWPALHRVTLASGITVTLNGSELYHLRRLEQHAVEIERETVVDLTWRGWDPESDFPRLVTLEEYAVDFDVDETVCGYCGARAEETCSHLPEAERIVVGALATDSPLLATLCGTR